MKRFFLSLAALAICTIFFSCSDLINTSKTELSLTLPAGQSACNNSRSADDTTVYTYKITFLHESGNETILSGKSGETIVLKPAAVGNYTISGQAYDANGKLSYEGSCTATAVFGTSSNVELLMTPVTEKTIVSETAHVKAESDVAGIKITLKCLASDIAWLWDNTYFTELSSGTCITMQELPKAGQSLVVYYPFTEKDKVYDFKFELSTEAGHFSEEVSAKAGGGDPSYFTYNSDFDNAELTIDSSGNFKLSKDFMSIFDNSKSFTMRQYYFDVYGSNKAAANASGVDSIDSADWIDAIRIDYADRADFVSSGVNLWTLNSSAAAKLSTYEYWALYLVVEFSISAYPNIVYRSNCKFSTREKFGRPEELLNSKHMSVEPSSSGVKITLKWLEGDGEWEQWYNLKEYKSRFGFNFYPYPNSDLMPTKENPTVDFVYPLTENGSTYTFIFASSADGEYKEEYVWCKAGGGLGELIDYEMWNNDIKPVINNEDYTFHVDGDVKALAAESDYEKFDNVYFEAQLWGGKSDFSDSQFYGSKYFYGSSIMNGEMAEEMPLPSSSYLLKERLSNWDTYFVQLSLLYVVPDNPIVFTSEGRSDEVKNIGERSSVKFVEGNTYFDGDWTLYYAGYEDVLSGITFSAENWDGCKFSIPCDFDNDYYEMQFQRKVTLVCEQKTYAVEFDLTTSMDVDKFEFDFFNDDGMCVSYQSLQNMELTALADETLHLSYEFTSEYESDYAATMCFIPFYEGSYKIENIKVTVKD